MDEITRRVAIKHLARGAAAGTALVMACGSTPAFFSNDATPSERDQMARVAADFMAKFDVPGLSVAIAQHGHLAYENAFGLARREPREQLTASHLFRIASVTKPITSVAIFSLVEKGKLRLADTVFGAQGILGKKYGTAPYQRFVEQITIDHLLTHTCGGWTNDRQDPMFQHPQMDHAQLISWTLDNQPLKFSPGIHYAYSNFGYCVLGRVIEELTNRTYSEYVREEVLARCGVRGMRIAGNTLADRAPNEVVYYGQQGENPYDMNVARMDSHGGWLATPRDLVLFANHVDGFKFTPNILQPETIRSMTAPSIASLNYARGWSVNDLGNWWHTGSLPGATTILVRTSSGFCWAALTNTRTKSDIALALDNLIWEMARKVSSWQL